LAGTVARSGDPATDDALVAALMSSNKDRREHQLVVDQIAAKLRPLASLHVPEAPSVVALRNVSHLGTSIKGTLYHGAGGWADNGAPGHSNGKNQGRSAALPTSLELAALLQPTPAVGGLPVDAAIQWQRDNEGFDRGCYAGPLGWVDRSGDGEWVLGLRSAHVSGNRAVMYAGNGIVVGSDPDAELGETQLKLQALLAALVRP
jgi:menaquinone-specific isochorismate synthase